MSVTSTRLLSDHELLDAARGGDEEAFRHSSRATAASCRRTATGCSARSTTPRTRSRRRCCARGAACPGSRGAARCAPGCTRSRPTSASTRSRAGRSAAADRLRPGQPSRATRRRAARRVGLARAVPGRDPRLDERLRGAGCGYEQREALELAFVAALQHLPAHAAGRPDPARRARLPAREVAESLDTTVPSVNSALQRARKAVAERLPARSQQATLRSLGDGRIRQLVEAYVDAWSRGDVDAVRALLAADATFSMPPWSSWWRGGDAIAEFAKEAVEFCAASLALPVSANGQAPLRTSNSTPRRAGTWRPRST